MPPLFIQYEARSKRGEDITGIAEVSCGPIRNLTDLKAVRDALKFDEPMEWVQIVSWRRFEE